MFKVRRLLTQPKPSSTKEVTKQPDMPYPKHTEESIFRRGGQQQKSIRENENVYIRHKSINKVQTTLRNNLIDNVNTLTFCNLLNKILKLYLEHNLQNKISLKQQIITLGQTLNISLANLEQLLPKNDYRFRTAKLAPHLDSLLQDMANTHSAKFYLATYGIDKTVFKHIEMQNYSFEDITFVEDGNIVTGYYDQDDETVSDASIKGRINFSVPQNSDAKIVCAKLTELLKLLLIFYKFTDTSLKITRLKFRTEKSLKEVLSHSSNLAAKHLATNNQITLYMGNGTDITTIESFLCKLDAYLVYYIGLDDDDSSKFGLDTRLNDCSYVSLRDDRKTFDSKIDTSLITEKQIRLEAMINLIQDYNKYNFTPSNGKKYNLTELKYLLVKIYNDNMEIRGSILEILNIPQ